MSIVKSYWAAPHKRHKVLNPYHPDAGQSEKN